MAKMMDARPTKYEGEAKTWDCIKDNLWDEVICYYNRQVNNREFDFCLLIPVDDNDYDHRQVQTFQDY